MPTARKERGRVSAQWLPGIATGTAEAPALLHLSFTPVRQQMRYTSVIKHCTQNISKGTYAGKTNHRIFANSSDTTRVAEYTS